MLSALVAAWPGSGLPKTAQSRSIHGAKTRSATAPATATSRSWPARQPMKAQVTPSQMASLRVSAARPISTPRQEDPRIDRRTAAPSRAIRGIRRQAPRARTANSIVESGRALWRRSGR